MTGSGAFGAVIVAAGRSERMGFDKLWAELQGRSVLAWSVLEIARSQPNHMVIVATLETTGRVEALITELGVVATVVPGGTRRRDSVMAGLLALPNSEWVVVHDAARPLVSAALVSAGLDAAQASGAAVPVLPLADTVKRVDGSRIVETLDRTSLRLVQTPQVFRKSLLVWALSVSDDDVTDEAGLIESLGGIVYTFQGQAENFKLTYPADLELMSDIIRRRAEPSGLS
jgi:2-C-methyl-D-erythritol 4-phosphate cytidylyltransferase